MSVRGPRGGRVCGQGTNRGRGRGRGRGGRTTVWELESYKPDPKVYDQLWHIRKEPVIVTPYLPDDCPIPNAQTRIIDRRQTDDEIQRNFYVVKVTYTAARCSSSEDEGSQNTETVFVDLSRILEYVSPDELERYENEQFQVEAEAEAVALRQEAEELAQKRLQKNARGPGAPKGSRMLNGLGLDSSARGRGRPRGRGRGRGRGAWRGRVDVTSRSRKLDSQQEGMVDEPDETIYRGEEDLQRIIAETASEEELSEDELPAQPSPGLARSALVTNSALSISPIAINRRISGILIPPRRQTSPSEVSDSDLDLIDEDAESIQQPTNTHSAQHVSNTAAPQTTYHPSKRQRTTSSNPTSKPPRQTTIPFSLSPSLPPSSRHDNDNAHPIINDDDEDTIHVLPPSTRAPSHSSAPPPANPSPAPSDPQAALSKTEEASEEEQFAIESITEHYYEASRKYYFVKWAGHDDAYDWLPEEELGGARELVDEYNRGVRRRKREMGVGMMGRGGGGGKKG